MRRLMTLVSSVRLQRIALVVRVGAFSWRDEVRRRVHGKGGGTSRKSSEKGLLPGQEDRGTERNPTLVDVAIASWPPVHNEAPSSTD